MPKAKTIYACNNCGTTYSKWMGKCNTCNEWNTLIEETIEAENRNKKSFVSKAISKSNTAPQNINEIQTETEFRFPSNNSEFDRVLGGGIVPGSIVLIGGEPGIGKSTLLLQLAIKTSLKVLYVSGEESKEQIKNRAERLGISNENCILYTETASSKIFNEIKKIQPELIIVDSIQTVYSPTIDSLPGSISQIKECTGELQRFAKESNTPIFLIGHITKDGQIAGPKILEHMVDTVLQFEGDRNHVYRILRTTKNRFGSTSEMGIYEMKNSGLQIVENPSEILITQKEDNLGGITIGATVEGQRPMLIETQALVSTPFYGTPQRSTTGFDARRLNMLLAVLEKRVGYNIGSKDIFLNIAGGLKIEDPAIDLAIVAALISSYEDRAVSMKSCFAGEIGLSGEVRSVNRIEQRIAEAEKLGFDRIFISKYNKKGIASKEYKIEIISLGKVVELTNLIF